MAAGKKRREWGHLKLINDGNVGGRKRRFAKSGSAKGGAAAKPKLMPQ